MGLTLRTAQRHQKGDHPDWLKFIGNTAAEGVARKSKEGGALKDAEAAALGAVSPVSPEDRPSFYDVPDGDLSPTQVAEKRAWDVHDRIYDMWLQMVGDQGPGGANPAVAIVYARELPKLRDDYVKARKDRESWEIEERMRVAMHEVEAFVRDFILPVAELLRNIPSVLPVRMNPDDPGFAREQALNWMRSEAEPQIQSMIDGAQRFIEE